MTRTALEALAGELLAATVLAGVLALVVGAAAVLELAELLDDAE